MYSYTLYIQFPSSGTHLTMDECRACDRQPFGGMIEQVLPDLIAWHSLDNEENLRAAYEYAKNAGMTDGASEVYCMAGEDGDEHVINPAFMAEAGSAPSADPESTEQAEQATTEQEAANTMTTAEKLMQYFKENEDDFNDSIEELDSYNGYLGDDRYYAMEDLDELYSGCSATELLNPVRFSGMTRRTGTMTHPEIRNTERSILTASTFIITVTEIWYQRIIRIIPID